MNQSDAEILWDVASVLARDAAKVSRPDEPTRLSPPPMLFFTDLDRTPRPWETAALLPAGAGVIYRAFGASEARETALRLREATRARGVLLLIGLDAELAEICDADGVHLPERALGQAAELSLARPDWRLTGAVHGAKALARCEKLDAAIVSPVFPAGGASSVRPALGLEVLSSLVTSAPCPVVALGGVNAGTALGLIGTGACGFAAVGAIQSAFGPD